MSDNVIKIVPSELDGNSRYAIRIRSVNSFGVPSDWSEAVVVDTDEASMETGGRITLTANGMIAYDDNGQTSFVYSGLGAGIRTNYVTNPSFETNATGWTALSNTSISRITSDFFVGEPAYKACLQIQASSNASGVGIVTAVAERVSVTPGTSFTVSAHIKPITSTVNLKIGVRFYSSGGTQLSESVSPSAKTVYANGQWSRLSHVDVTVPTGAAKLGFVIYSTNTMSSGQKYLIDGILVEQASTLGDYFDGSTSLGVTEWTGTPHASSSTFDMSSSYYVDGGVFTAGTLQTAVDVGIGSPYGAPGVKMSTSGIQGYSGLQATPAFSLDANGKFRVGSDTQFMYFDGANLTITGNIAAGTIDIGGFDSTSFHVDASGNMWMGAGSYSVAPMKILSTGDLFSTSLNLLGGATPSDIAATWGLYEFNDNTGIVTGQYGLSLDHGSYQTNLLPSGLVWTQFGEVWERLGSIPPYTYAYRSDESVYLVGPSHKDKNSFVKLNTITSHSDTRFFTVTEGRDHATPISYLELRADNVTQYAKDSGSFLSEDDMQVGVMASRVIFSQASGATPSSKLIVSTGRVNANSAPAAMPGTDTEKLLITEYGQIALGPGVPEVLAQNPPIPWTSGNRGNANFQQAAAVIVDSDAISNATLSLRHSNRGVDSTKGLDFVVVRSDGTAFIINRDNAAMRFRTNDTNRAEFDSSGHFKPTSDNTYTCGANGNRWSAVWAATGTIQTSDLRTKTDIKPTDLGLQFIEKLNPVSFKFIIGGNEVIKDNDFGHEIKSKPGTRNHYGLIAQEVKEVLNNLEISDFGGWILTDPNDPDSEQGLRYEQFISPLIKAVQELALKVNNLENLLNK